MKIKPAWLSTLVAFLAWAAVFGIVYAQSPLYTSNQNTYFLRGLAQAGVGYLNRDWLANTRELMPLFSKLVYLTQLVFHSQNASYIYFALLLGVYLVAMFYSMDLLFNLRRSKACTLTFIALFLTFHSAAFRFLLSRGVGADASFLFEGGVAGQRILGQVYQPSVFGVFLMLSIYLFLRKRSFLSLLPMVVAIYFHPVYLLSGALLTLGYMWVVFREDRNLKRSALLGGLAILLVAPSVVYTLYISWPLSGDIAQKVLDILVHFRNPHHALISSWLDWTVIVKGMIVLAALIVIRKTRLFSIMVMVTLGIVALTIVEMITGSDTLALLFPWRASILLVPLGTTILLAFGITKILDRCPIQKKTERLMIFACLVFITGLMVIGVIRTQIEAADQRSNPARPMMAYIAAHKSPTDVYLIPPKMSDFRLVTGAPIYIDYDTTPDRNEDVLEWYRRLYRVYTFYNENPEACLTIRELKSQEGVTHAVLETGSPLATCPGLIPVYNDSFYSIYAIKP